MQSNNDFILKTLEQRRKEFSKLKAKYPEKCPIILSIAGKNISSEFKTQKFLVAPHVTLRDLLQNVRSKVKINDSEALFIFVDNRVIPVLTKSLDEIYCKYHNKEDGFLYLDIQTENTFG